MALIVLSMFVMVIFNKEKIVVLGEFKQLPTELDAKSILSDQRHY